jgi:hypothetical protein
VHYEPAATGSPRTPVSGGGLPLLGFALTELWPKQRQRQRQISLAEYRSVGGMGSLSAYAERVYGTFRIGSRGPSPDAHRAAGAERQRRPDGW